MSRILTGVAIAVAAGCGRFRQVRTKIKTDRALYCPNLPAPVRSIYNYFMHRFPTIRFVIPTRAAAAFDHPDWIGLPVMENSIEVHTGVPFSILSASASVLTT